MMDINIDQLLGFQDMEMWLLVYYIACVAAFIGLTMAVKGMFTFVQAFIIAAIMPMFMIFEPNSAQVEFPFWVRWVEPILSVDMEAIENAIQFSIDTYLHQYLLWFLAFFVVYFLFLQLFKSD